MCHTYCSQDLWLGNTSQSHNYIRSGSNIVEAVLDHWFDEVTQAQTVVDTLVVSGMSAGSMAVLNHFPSIRSISQAAGVKNLRLVLDSSLYTDGIDTDFSYFIEQAVDPQQHPLCFEEGTIELQHESLSKLPCCLSTHCMLRHGSALSEWARNSSSGSEVSDISGLDVRMLLIDSSYDSLQAFIELGSDNSPRNAMDDLTSLDGVASTTFNVAEYAGRRKSRVLETMFGGERQLDPNNVFWVMTSAPSHNVIIPSLFLFSRICDEVNATKSSCEGTGECAFSNYPLGILPVCNSTGRGLRLSLSNGLNMTLWTTTETWNLIRINGRSVRDIISRFITQELKEEEGNLLTEACPGPSCVPKDSSEESMAKYLVEVDNVFTPISTWLRVLLTVILGLVPVFFLLAVYGPNIKERRQIQARRDDDNSETGPPNKPCDTKLWLKGLSVSSNKGAKILDDVSVDFKYSSLIALLGKSGSGKSCFLGVLR